MVSRKPVDESLIADRRGVFFILNAFLWAFGAMLMAARISGHGWTPAAMGLFVLFLLLQAQIVYGFTIAVTGWWMLRRGGDPFRINQTLPEDFVPSALPVTAVIIPIFNEDVGRVFQGVRVMYESLAATGFGSSFDFYILSDSSDLSVWIEEEKAWFELCKQVDGFGHIFYRKRKVTLHHKSGNVADFCRRWGAKYPYLIVLDADSIMRGNLFVRLVALMEKNPIIGMIQTYSRPVLGQSLFQRVNQFASFAYGPLFSAGANFWQLDNASFYGHNAIIRVQPFMKFCAMPELPPSGRLGTRILSHDTVEAALIRRAGYEVWCDYDLEGSYEEGPPHLLASLKRDRRWCHGNMQHFWFLFCRGLTLPSRINILVGIMAYLGSPLWLLFLLFSPVMFIGGQVHARSAPLFICAMVLLFVPKLLAAERLVSNPGMLSLRHARWKFFASTVAEAIYSMLLAPILMLFYTRFVWSSFFGSGVGWGRQKRADSVGPAWSDCFMAHWAHTLLALVAGVLVGWFVPPMLPWFMMVLAGPLVSIPFTRFSASNGLGLAALRKGLFVIPEELQPPSELRAVQEPFGAFAGETLLKPDGYGEDYGLVQTILDPRTNALHISLLRERPKVSLETHERLVALCNLLLYDGPGALPLREKRMLLWDADAMIALHHRLWSSPLSDYHQWWREAFLEYLKRAPLQSA